MENSLTSVIIPTYQCAQFIVEAIESVLAQTYKACEIIVVDDGSKDDTLRVLEHYQDRIVLISQENKGLPAARNVGIKASQGEFIAFLDADDVWLPDKLEKQIPLFQQNNEVGLVCSDIYYFDDVGKKSFTAFEQVPPRAGSVSETIFVRSFIPMPSVVVRRKCFDEVGFFDETLRSCEDLDMWLRVSKIWKVDFVNQLLACYRLRPGQLSENVEIMKTTLLSVMEKYFDIWPELHKLKDLDIYFFSLYYQIASLKLRQRDPMKARAYLNSCKTRRGFTFKFFIYWVATFFPPQIYIFLVDKIKRVGSMLASKRPGVVASLF
jgi:glycosyltransferase involved in cell wall biosynthesis